MCDIVVNDLIEKQRICVEMASAMIRAFSRGMATKVDGINHVTVIGGGLMGSGIAQVSVDILFEFKVQTENQFEMFRLKEKKTKKKSLIVAYRP